MIIFITIFYLKKINTELKNLSHSPDIIGLKKSSIFAYFSKPLAKKCRPQQNLGRPDTMKISSETTYVFAITHVFVYTYL